MKKFWKIEYPKSKYPEESIERRMEKILEFDNVFEKFFFDVWCKFMDIKKWLAKVKINLRLKNKEET